jgi:hypothetical protein
MSDYAYKPRLGFDIRIRPPEADAGEPPAWAPAVERTCDVAGCGARATFRTARSPRDPSAKLWLCAAHAQEHNRSWNYFAGLSESEAEAARLATIYGDRPTWRLGRTARARNTQRARGPSDFLDTFGLFGEARRPPVAPGRMRDGRALSRLQIKAFETLGLQTNAKGPDIRRRFAELLRRFHPDANGGDRSAEAQLNEVVRAHQILKKSRIC